MTYEIEVAGKMGKVRILNTVGMTYSKAMWPAQVPQAIGGLTFRQEIMWQRIARMTVHKGSTLSNDEIEQIRNEVGMKVLA